MDDRLKSIVQAAPESVTQQDKSFWLQAKRAVLSKAGMAVLAFVLVFVLLIACRPTYVYQKDPNGINGRSRKRINFILIVGLSAAAAALVVLIPYLIERGTHKA